MNQPGAAQHDKDRDTYLISAVARSKLCPSPRETAGRFTMQPITSMHPTGWPTESNGGDIQELAKLLGDQRTINVPSWSPDSRSVAFVSYQLAAQ